VPIDFHDAANRRSYSGRDADDDELRSRLPAGPLEERDRWTLWRAAVA
jgi:hypothetical protein